MSHLQAIGNMWEEPECGQRENDAGCVGGGLLSARPVLHCEVHEAPHGDPPNDDQEGKQQLHRRGSLDGREGFSTRWGADGLCLGDEQRPLWDGRGIPYERRPIRRCGDSGRVVHSHRTGVCTSQREPRGSHRAVDQAVDQAEEVGPETEVVPRRSANSRG